MRISLTGILLFLASADRALGQSYERSVWSNLSMYVPLLVLVVVWIFIWRKGFGKGGYRKLIVDNQDRMAQIERHLGEISQRLERIASWLEKSGK
jgi:hypothetical protein